uniref:Uncharacterized protein n=1 Tax=Arundo donax TaxID=35708 RepID=A0A0A9AZG8_ARUDO
MALLTIKRSKMKNLKMLLIASSGYREMKEHYIGATLQWKSMKMQVVW